MLLILEKSKNNVRVKQKWLIARHIEYWAPISFCFWLFENNKNFSNDHGFAEMWYVIYFKHNHTTFDIEYVCAWHQISHYNFKNVIHFWDHRPFKTTREACARRLRFCPFSSGIEWAWVFDNWQLFSLMAANHYLLSYVKTDVISVHRYL